MRQILFVQGAGKDVHDHLANRDHQLNNNLSEVASDIRELEANSPDVRRTRASSRGFATPQ